MVLRITIILRKFLSGRFLAWHVAYERVTDSETGAGVASEKFAGMGIDSMLLFLRVLLVHELILQMFFM